MNTHVRQQILPFTHIILQLQGIDGELNLLITAGERLMVQSTKKTQPVRQGWLKVLLCHFAMSLFYFGLKSHWERGRLTSTVEIKFLQPKNQNLLWSDINYARLLWPTPYGVAKVDFASQILVLILSGESLSDCCTNK